jgi:hypothetical protein
MDKAHTTNGKLKEELLPAEAMDERFRRIDECVLKLMELPVDDRSYVISLVTTLQRQIDVALLEKRVAEEGSLQKFLDDLDDFEEDEVIIDTNGNGQGRLTHQ